MFTCQEEGGKGTEAVKPTWRQNKTDKQTDRNVCRDTEWEAVMKERAQQWDMGNNSSLLEVEGRLLAACGGGFYSNTGHRLVALPFAGLD